MSFSVVLARGLLAEVRRRGGDPQALLEQCGIEQARLSELAQTLNAPEFERLLAGAQEFTQDPAIGLTLATHAPDHMLQVLGQLMFAQRTLREAYSMLRRYSDLLADGLTWSLAERGELAWLECTAPSGEDVTRCLMDFALAVSARVARQFTLDRVCFDQVHLQHAATSYAEQYEAIFDCEARFEQTSYALAFPARWLDEIQPHADSTVSAAAESLAERLLHERVTALSTAERVLGLLQYEHDWHQIDIQKIARRLGYSVRALRRRLSMERCSISELLDETRCRIACEELSRPDSSIKEVAELLGFSEPSAFHRAFRRWTGRTPGDYLQQDRFKPASEIMLTPRRAAPVLQVKHHARRAV